MQGWIVKKVKNGIPELGQETRTNTNRISVYKDDGGHILARRNVCGGSEMYNYLPVKKNLIDKEVSGHKWEENGKRLCVKEKKKLTTAEINPIYESSF
jgi:hypothetical protein